MNSRSKCAVVLTRHNKMFQRYLGFTTVDSVRKIELREANSIFCTKILANFSLSPCLFYINLITVMDTLISIEENKCILGVHNCTLSFTLRVLRNYNA